MRGRSIKLVRSTTRPHAPTVHSCGHIHALDLDLVSIHLTVHSSDRAPTDYSSAHTTWTCVQGLLRDSAHSFVHGSGILSTPSRVLEFDQVQSEPSLLCNTGVQSCCMYCGETQGMALMGENRCGQPNSGQSLIFLRKGNENGKDLYFWNLPYLLIQHLVDALCY